MDLRINWIPILFRESVLNCERVQKRNWFGLDLKNSLPDQIPIREKGSGGWGYGAARLDSPHTLQSGEFEWTRNHLNWTEMVPNWQYDQLSRQLYRLLRLCHFNCYTLMDVIALRSHYKSGFRITSLTDERRHAFSFGSDPATGWDDVVWESSADRRHHVLTCQLSTSKWNNSVGVCLAFPRRE